MRIIVHYPKSEKELSELGEKVAKIHTETIISHLNSLSCSNEQKLQIIEKIKER